MDYFLGTTAEGFVLSRASLKNNKHLNILIPSLLKSNNILVKQTEPMVNSDSSWRVTVSQGVSHTTCAQNHALHGLDIRLHVM